MPALENHKSVETSTVGAKITDVAMLTIADRTIITSANIFIEISLPVKIFIRLGWRTNKLRRVPYVYSCAVCAANTHNAIIPKNPPTLAKP